jgi:hypothetical protein
MIEMTAPSTLFFLCRLPYWRAIIDEIVTGMKSRSSVVETVTAQVLVEASTAPIDPWLQPLAFPTGTNISPLISL